MYVVERCAEGGQYDGQFIEASFARDLRRQVNERASKQVGRRWAGGRVSPDRVSADEPSSSPTTIRRSRARSPEKSRGFVSERTWSQRCNDGVPSCTCTCTRAKPFLSTNGNNGNLKITLPALPF